MAEEELYLLDGNSLLYRAFYALPETLTTSDGTVTNAVYGFTSMLLSLIDDKDPDMIGVAFDLAAPTFRHKEYEDYKANRSETPDDLKPQFGMVKELLQALRIPIFQLEGYEADDLIGTLAKKAEREGYKVTIVTGDRDALQLISEDINIVYTQRGITNTVNYNLERFREDYQLEPIQLIDKKGLMGDKSDNIPGVDGIGDKTSTKLLKEFNTLENVLDNIDKVGGKKRKATLREQADRARLSKKLATIDVDAPLEVDFGSLNLSSMANQDVYDLFIKFEFNSLLARIGGYQETKEVDYKEISSLKELEITVDKVAFSLDLEAGQFLKGAVISLADGTNYYLDLSKEELLDFIKDNLLDKRLLMIGAKDEIKYLLKEGVKIDNLHFEPLLADYLLRPSSDEKDFIKLVEERLQKTLPDVEGRELLILQTSLLFKLEEELIEQLKEDNMLELFTQIEIPLVKVLAQLELNGIKASKEELKRLSVVLKEKIREIEEEVYEIAGEEFNLNSPKQLGVILFEKMGLPVIKRTKTGYSTSANVLEKLEKNYPIASFISNYRTYTKLESTYVEPLEEYINEETGRIHTTFNQRVTATGRLSSTEPNLQNIPIRTEEGRKIRGVFVAEEGKKLLAADYSQIELRVLAHISEDEGLKEAYRQGVDIHTKTAQELFGLATKETRRRAKAVNFGIAYGISDWGLAKQLKIGNQEAQEYIDLYFSRYPKVKKYIDKTITQAKKEGYVTTIFNRRRYLPEIKSKNYHRRNFAKRMAINTPIQGSAADIMKIAMIDVTEALEKEGFESKVLLQVHDELILEVPEDELEAVSRVVRDKMEAAVELDIKLEADLKVGDNWKKMEAVISNK